MLRREMTFVMEGDSAVEIMTEGGCSLGGAR